MVEFVIAVAGAAFVVPAYIALAVQSFRTVRRGLLAGQMGRDSAERSGTVTGDADGSLYEIQLRHFTAKAAGGVLVSGGLVVLVSHVAWAWYLLPALCFGSALAVIAAFVIDRTEAQEGAPTRQAL